MTGVSAVMSRWLGAVVALGALAGCGGPVEETHQVCGQGAYDAAVLHTESPTERDVVHGLFPISRSNNQLVWSADGTQVLMVQWTSFTGYKQGDNLLSRDIFVTAAPQVKQFCATVAAESQPERLIQYLGLPPEGDRALARNFVEMWVTPDNMFRPCADPEIDDDTCSLTFPANVTQAHKDWVNKQFSGSYAPWLTTKYPWTALGYTYDWCGSTTPVGASEYVIRAGSTVSVKATTATNAYCASP